MPYTIIISQTASPSGDVPAPSPTKIFEQTVENLDLKAVINTINAKPRKPRATKKL